MVSVVACLILGLMLVAAAGLKAAGGPSARAAFATYGLRSHRAMTAAWGAVIAIELALGALVALGSTAAARAAAIFLSLATLAQIAALAAGRAGAPCACFGAKGRLSPQSAGRTAMLAAALALAPILPRSTPTTDQWLTIGLVAALIGLAALTVVVFALAREVGMLRLSVAPQGALEIAHEGPEVGAYSALAHEFELRHGQIGLAVFTSEGCGLCRVLKPSIDAFGEHHAIALKTFDELEHADAWAAADVPGSPFAVTLDTDGTVLSKGTFNTGAQLESVLHAAERRRGMVRA